MWAILNSAACRKVSVNAQLSGTRELIIFFFKTRCWKAPWPEGSSVCSAVCGVKYHTPAPPVPAPSLKCPQFEIQPRLETLPNVSQRSLSGFSAWDA